MYIKRYVTYYCNTLLFTRWKETVAVMKERGMRLVTRIVTEADSEGKFENPRMARLMLTFSLPLRTKDGRKVT